MTTPSSFPLSLPSREEQTEIVRRIETLFAFADRLEARLQAAQTAADRLTPLVAGQGLSRRAGAARPERRASRRTVAALASHNASQACRQAWP